MYQFPYILSDYLCLSIVVYFFLISISVVEIVGKIECAECRDSDRETRKYLILGKY